MIKNYVLIDYENVQPKSLSLLLEQNFHILVFVGAAQKSISTDIVKALQPFGDRAKYIQVTDIGKNALDFHITYYIGVLSMKDQKAVFYIISKDTGYDPLVKHLISRKIRIQRLSTIRSILKPKIPKPSTMDNTLKSIITNLIGRGESKPKKECTLSSTIDSLLDKMQSSLKLHDILDQLQSKNYIKITDGDVTYNLPQKITVVRAG
jgi:PIN domain-containing protein